MTHAGVEPEEVDHVFLTHLHFDHCGAVTAFDGSHFHPTFPRARHFVQRREYEILLNPDPRSQASYVVDNLQAVRDAGLLELVDGEAEPVPGFRLQPAPGHTQGHQVVEVISGSEGLVFLGDLIPFVSHLRLNWTAATDTEPLVTMSVKERVLAGARERGYAMVMYHEHATPVGHLAAEGLEPF